MIREELMFAAAFSEQVDARLAEELTSESEDEEHPDLERQWHDDDIESTGSDEEVCGILEGDSSDTENFKLQLKGED